MINILENVNKEVKEVEIKYRSVKKQQEAIADKLYEVSPENSEELEKLSKTSEKKLRLIFYSVVKSSQPIKKTCSVKKSSVVHNALDYG